MTPLTEQEFWEMLDKIDEYETEQDIVNGVQLTSYYRFEKRFAQEMMDSEGLTHYVVDPQHCERILKIQEQDVR